MSDADPIPILGHSFGCLQEIHVQHATSLIKVFYVHLRPLLHNHAPSVCKQAIVGCHVHLETEAA